MNFLIRFFINVLQVLYKFAFEILEIINGFISHFLCINPSRDIKTKYYFNGDIYKGEWKNGSRHGEGIIYYKNGDKFKGSFENDQIFGIGTYYFNNGNILTGEFNNKFIERGILEIANGKGKYEGEFLNNKFHGKGKFMFFNGDIYEGDWKNGLKDGHGVYYYQNQSEYDGEWTNDKKNGHGIFYNRETGDSYDGNWYNGIIVKGVLNTNDGDRYKGTFKDSQLDGVGEFHYKNGDIYFGEWSEGKKCGKGILNRPDGFRYEGNFFNNKYNGQGIIYFHNEDRFEGEFKDGKKCGQGKLYRKNGEIECNEWLDDEIVIKKSEESFLEELKKSQCLICLESLAILKQNEIISTKCGHLYCKSCLDEYFKISISSTCPYCKKSCYSFECHPLFFV